MIIRFSGRCFRLATIAVVAALILQGCGEPAPYPEPRATSLIGQSGKCEACQTEITEVTEENLLTIQGIRYVVCDEECAADLEEWVKTH